MPSDKLQAKGGKDETPVTLFLALDCLGIFFSTISLLYSMPIQTGPFFQHWQKTVIINVISG